MDDAVYAEMMEKINALEARIEALEHEKNISNAYMGVEKLLAQYPYMMNKSQAAEVIGVTRATVYAMIDDGRLMENEIGKVTTRSVARLLASGNVRRRNRRAAG